LIGNGRGDQTVVEQKGYRKTWAKYSGSCIGLILLRALTSLTAFAVSEEKVVKHVEESSNFHHFPYMNAVQKLAIL